MPTTMPPRCPECGADWADGRTCTDHFHMLGFWELDHQLLDVHHLMVLCYHIQHPSLYAPATLAEAQRMLALFVEQGLTPQAMRKRVSAWANPGVRTQKITGTAEAHGAYAHPVPWTLRVTDVTAAGMERYYDSVRAWAAAILADLRAFGYPA